MIFELDKMRKDLAFQFGGGHRLLLTPLAALGLVRIGMSSLSF
jgi:hypothetical protein